jgi:1,5-anhydro-D-fructose reductase (1,5-anhydro-D-mannitol-forming)
MRVLIVGHGLIGKTRARGLVARGGDFDAKLAGTVDLQPRAANLYEGAPHFTSLDAVPGDSFDAAILAVPHHLARPLGLRLLHAGKPVLIEKPLGITREEASTLVEAARGLLRPSFVGYNYRFMPGVSAALAQARSGALGRLRSIDMMLGHGGQPGSTDDWKLRPDLAGGGALIDPGVHLLDLLLVLAPDIEPRTAAATSGFWKTGIEEDAVALLGHAGLLATVRSSRIRWVNTFRIEIVGDDGYALVEGRGGTYGPQTVRFGKRWGWNDGSGRSQRATEEVRAFGEVSASFDDELAAVLASWRDPARELPELHPCTFPEGLRVADVTARLYAQLGIER